jgi:hypothetical protein
MVCSRQPKANSIPVLSMVAEVADTVLGGLQTRHATIRQKKRALVAFPTTRSFLSTDGAPHVKRKKAKDKSNGTRGWKGSTVVLAITFSTGEGWEKNEDGRLQPL